MRELGFGQQTEVQNVLRACVCRVVWGSNQGLSNGGEGHFPHLASPRITEPQNQASFLAKAGGGSPILTNCPFIYEG